MADEDPSKQDLAEQRTELAEDRTGWAQERTLLAKQRTFAAWVRTGLSTLAVGFAGTELLGELEPQWLIRSAGAALIVVAAAVFVIGFAGYRDTFRKLKEAGVVSIPLWTVALITGALVLTAVAAFVLMLLN